MKKRILIFGKGFIGQRLKEAFGWSLSEKKIFTYKHAEEEIEKFHPEIIINCIGYTGKSNVDGCEADFTATLSANTFVPIILAEAAIRNKIKLVHISSGCIYRFDYSKDRPLTEEHTPDFFDLYYSRTKIYAERSLSVLSSQKDILITRIRIPLDNKPHPKNILTKLINYKKAIDIPNSVTYLPDFINALGYLIKINARGIYNLVNTGSLRYPLLLDVYKKYVPEFKYEVIDYKQLHLIRTNLLLSARKLEKTNFTMRNINDVLEECVQGYLSFQENRLRR